MVARLSFDDLISQALPLTRWWHDQIVDAEEKRPDETFLPDWLKDADRSKLAPQVQWLIEVVVRLLAQRVTGAGGPKKIEQAAIALLGKSVRSSRRKTQDDPSVPMLWLVSRNRPAQFAIWGSRPAVKADAAVELFSIDCSSIGWAVIDCGVDARHPALCARGDDGLLKPAFERDEATKTVRNNSRVVATYDFTTLRERLGRRREARPGTDGRGAGSAPGPATGAEERALDRLGGAGADPARAARPASRTNRRPSTTGRTWPGS